MTKKQTKCLSFCPTHKGDHPEPTTQTLTIPFFLKKYIRFTFNLIYLVLSPWALLNHSFLLLLKSIFVPFKGGNQVRTPWSPSWFCLCLSVTLIKLHYSVIIPSSSRTMWHLGATLLDVKRLFKRLSVQRIQLCSCSCNGF